MAVIATWRSRLTGLPTALTFRLVLRGVIEIIRAIASGLLLGTAAKTLGLQLANLTAELFVFLFQRRHATHRIGVSAAPIPGLLPQFQILSPQPGYFGAQLVHFGQQPNDQHCQICWLGIQRCEQDTIHDSCVVPSEKLAKIDELGHP